VKESANYLFYGIRVLSKYRIMAFSVTGFFERGWRRRWQEKGLRDLCILYRALLQGNTGNGAGNYRALVQGFGRNTGNGDRNS